METNEAETLELWCKISIEYLLASAKRRRLFLDAVLHVIGSTCLQPVQYQLYSAFSGSPQTHTVLY